ETFVALRAVRRHADEIRALAPQNITPELIDQGAAGMKLHGEGRVSVQNNSFDGGNIRWRRQTGHFHVAESVKREVRLILLRSFSGKNETVGGFCGAQIVGVQRAVGVHDFRKAQLHLFASGSGNPQSRHAGKVLPEVIDDDTWLGATDAFGVEQFLDADWWKRLRDDGRLNRVHEFGRLPLRVIESRGIPARLLSPRVVGLTIVNFRLPDG